MAYKGGSVAEQIDNAVKYEKELERKAIQKMKMQEGKPRIKDRNVKNLTVEAPNGRIVLLVDNTDDFRGDKDFMCCGTHVYTRRVRTEDDLKILSEVSFDDVSLVGPIDEYLLSLMLKKLPKKCGGLADKKTIRMNPCKAVHNETKETYVFPNLTTAAKFIRKQRGGTEKAILSSIYQGFSRTSHCALNYRWYRLTEGEYQALKEEYGWRP